MKKNITNQTQFYTYKQILIGLRNEFLIFQEKLDQLSEYIVTTEESQQTNTSTNVKYNFDLYQNPFNGELPELVLDRKSIKKSLLEWLGLKSNHTHAFMVKNNNGIYYPMCFDQHNAKLFNIIIKPGYENIFRELVEDILNSDFAKYMHSISPLSSSQNDSLDNTIFSRLIRKIPSYGLDLRTTNVQLTYLGRTDVLEFRSLRTIDEKYIPLTREFLEDIINIKFPKDKFNPYHQSLIDKSIDDDRLILLSNDYQPQTSADFSIQSTEKQLVLTINQNKR